MPQQACVMVGAATRGSSSVRAADSAHHAAAAHEQAQAGGLVRPCAVCAGAEARDLALFTCDGLRFRAACAAVAERTRGTRAGSASAATRHADREWSQCCLQIDCDFNGLLSRMEICGRMD